MSVTGVAFEERSKICAMVQELGGIYSPELKPQCSHLIYEDAAGSEEPNKSLISMMPSQSQLPIKVQYALKWDIPVVSKAWIYACYAQKSLLEESDYPGLQASKGQLEESVGAEILPLQLSEIHENVPSFLHGCNIYLNGDSISNQRLAVLKRLVLAAGGVRYTDLDSEALTHIVIHNQLLPNNLKSFLDRQDSLDCNVKLVHDNWLFDSYREGKRLLEDDYLVNKVNRESSQSAPEAGSKWKRGAFNQAATSNANSSTVFNSNSNTSAVFNNANSSFFSANSSFVNANAANVTLNTDLKGAEEFLAGTPNVLESAEKFLKKKAVYMGNLVGTIDEKTRKRLFGKARKLGIKIVDDEAEGDWCITGVLISTESFKKLTRNRSPLDLRNFIWFEAALDSKTHLPSPSFAYPLHCSRVPLADLLCDSVISQSGFTGAEREFYAELIKAAGAQYTDSLSKANTHLVIEEPRRGTKYEFARKWKIQCIDMEWFKTRFSSESRDEIGNENKRINSCEERNLNTSINVKEMTKSRRPPQHPQNSLSLPSQNSNSASASLLSKARLSFQTHSQEASFGTVSKSVESSGADSRGIFKGLIFASSQRLWHRRDELSSIVESLGGIFLWSFDRSCTHYLHQGMVADEAFKEFKQARQWDKFIVSPWWVMKCREQGTLLDEALFPHTYKETTNDDDDDGSSSNLMITSPVEDKIDWDRILAEKRAQESLLRPGSKTFNIDLHPHHSQDFPMDSSAKGQNPQQPVVIKYKVLFSGFTSAERAELMHLASNRSDLQILPEDEPIEWNPRQTLLICNSLNFTEKIFSACATGCWILRKDFLEASPSAGITTSLLEKYEIGPMWNSNERENLIGRAPRYWRMKLSIEGDDGRPFKGWKCLVMVESTRQALYESVLRNGGATLIDPLNRPPNLSQITHIFCGTVRAIPETWRPHLRAEQIYSTKHITNTIFRLND